MQIESIEDQRNDLLRGKVHDYIRDDYYRR